MSPNPSICLAKTFEYPKSLEIHVKDAGFPANEIDLNGFRFFLNLPINSADKCILSDALPPFPDLIIGFHSTMFFTMGSVVLIGIMSKFFNKSILIRIFGALGGALIFYILTNFGVWLSGTYGYSLVGLTNCYVLALPFFGYSIISTLFFSVIIESVYKFFQKNSFNLIK